MPAGLQPAAFDHSATHPILQLKYLGEGGFEPPKDMPAGLQPAAFDHSATHPDTTLDHKTIEPPTWVKSQRSDPR
jgi:hypothetical protein